MMTLESASLGFAAVGSEHRLAVLQTLVKAGPAGLTVGEIQHRLEIPASTLAHHLRFLSEGQLITQEKQGRSVVNRADFDHIASLATFLLDECCADASNPDAHCPPGRPC